MTVLDQVVRHGDVEVIRCRGRIVLGETDELRTAALAGIQSTARIVLHLSEVPYIDSTGLGLLAFLCVSARKVSGDMKLVAPSAQVAEILETTMLGSVFDIYPSEEAALAAFAGYAKSPSRADRYRTV